MKNFLLIAIFFVLLISVSFIDISTFAMHEGKSHHEDMMDHQNMTGYRHIPHHGICAPGFAPLGEICVLNDRCGPGVYPGKLCMMDGKVQPYLRPLQQGSAGISVDNVICAEELELIFKSHDASPACVESNTAKTLQDRGWQKTKPNLACTLEYAPVCGVDGKTYGNRCMLNSEHIDMKHQGECQVKLTEFELDKKYHEIQAKISKVTGDIYNGKYHGNIPLDEALQILKDGKIQLEAIHDKYNMLNVESKTDMQIAMRFSTLGKMGFASIDSQINMIKDQMIKPLDTSGVFSDALQYTQKAPAMDSKKGYFVTEIANNVYWLSSNGYQTMFVTTGEGVVAIDAPQPIGQKYLDAISQVTSEPITHMIYSHNHQDHTGSAGQIFPADITYISHIGTANVLSEENDPNRPVPNETFQGERYTIKVGQQTIELHHLGNFHSDGDILIFLPQQKVAMLVDLMRPGTSPYRAFGVTPDIDLYLQTHDVLQNFDFDVLISGHTDILATKEHIKTNKQFTLDVMENAKQALQMTGSNAVNTCVQLTTEQWQGKLEGLDTFMADHCTAMIEYLSQS